MELDSMNNGIPELFDLEKWQQLLCRYISNENTKFAREHAKKLLLCISKSKHKYYSLRDASVLEHSYTSILQLR
jgi:hypothetical protein